MSTGLLVSSIIVILFGFTRWFLLLVILFLAPSTYLFSLDESDMPYLTEGDVRPALMDIFEDKGIVLKQGARISVIGEGEAEGLIYDGALRHADLRAYI